MGKLFGIDDLQLPEVDDKGKYQSVKLEDTNSTNLVRLTADQKQYKSLEDCLGFIKTHSTYKFITDGAWSMHHLLRYCLEQLGPADVYLCTWTLTEEPARAILQVYREMRIKSLHCLFDHRIHTRAPGAHQIIKEIANTIKLTKTHAKVTVIKGTNCSASIVASANYTRNRRLEAGTIFTDPAAVAFDLEWIKDELKKDTE